MGGNMKSFQVSTSSRNEFISITSKVTDKLNKIGIEEGVCTVYCPHTTGAITINESADPNVVRDMNRKLKELVPSNDSYKHREGNSDSHIKSSIIGNTVQIIVENGELQLGTWQGIFFCEFDGPRTRKVWVKVN